jgi:oxygen-independent coproporphyrinogen-3 oxidase
VHTVFIGGGTPSLFSPRSIERLITMLRTYLRLSADAEITLEANPGTFERERFEGFAQAGVTRLSIGVQTFDDTALAAIGRVHDADQALRAVECAAGIFKTWNLDLMYALPQQTLAMLSRDLDCALQFRPPHLSCYHLTLEPQTPFAKKPPPLPDEDLAADMQALVEVRLSEAGLEPYEVSAYAQPDHRCRHNLNYWRFGDYLGLGAGAHGKLSFHDRIVREVRVRHPGQYMTKPPVADMRVLSATDLPFEFMLNALRLVEGVPASDFEARTGLSLARIAKPLQVAVADGLLDASPAYLRATELGRRFLNDLQARFLAD